MPHSCSSGLTAQNFSITTGKPIQHQGRTVNPFPFDGEVSGCLHRADGAIPDRLHDDSPLTAHPRDHGRPVFVIMAPAGLAFLPATTRPTSQVPFAPLCRLPLIPSGVIEFIPFDRTLQVAIHPAGQGGVTQPPAPAIVGADMNAYAFMIRWLLPGVQFVAKVLLRQQPGGNTIPSPDCRPAVACARFIRHLKHLAPVLRHAGHMASIVLLLLGSAASARKNPSSRISIAADRTDAS